MKKLCLALLLCVSACATSFSMTLREGFDEIKQLPDLKGVVSDRWIDILGGWFDSIPVDGAEIVGKAHEVGAGQTVYYGSRVEEIAKSLPQEYKILSGADYSNLIYFFAERIDDNNWLKPKIRCIDFQKSVKLAS